MKNLILILSIFIFGSCTLDGQANLDLQCPCVITEVGDYDSDKIYEVRATPTYSKGGTFFNFRSTHKYNLGDTIH